MAKILEQDWKAGCFLLIIWIPVSVQTSGQAQAQATTGGQYLSTEETVLKTNKGYDMPGSILKPVAEEQLGLAPKYLEEIKTVWEAWLLSSHGSQCGIVQAQLIELQKVRCKMLEAACSPQ